MTDSISKLADRYLAADLPRATRRPPGRKFREKLAEWMTRDLQSKLEAGGVPQKKIDSMIENLTGEYGPLFATEWSGGYTGEGFKNFATQQDAVDWLAGRSAVERAPGGAFGKTRYPEIIEEAIARYGGGGEVRDKAQGLLNKLSEHQKALAAAAAGQTGSLMYDKRKLAAALEDLVERSPKDTLQSLIPLLEWASKIPEWPEPRF